MANRSLEVLFLLCALAASAHAQSGGDDPVPVYGPGTLRPPVRNLPDPVRAPRSNLTRACRVDLGTPPRVTAGGAGELLLTITAKPGLALSAEDELEVRAEGPGLRFEEAATRHRSATVGHGLDWVVVRLPFTAEANASPGTHPVQVRATARFVRQPSGEDLGWMTDDLTTQVVVTVEPVRGSPRDASPDRPPRSGEPRTDSSDPSADSAGMARDLLQEPTVPPPSDPEPSPLAEPLKPGALGAVALLLAAAAAVLLFRLRNAKPPTR